MENTQHWLLPEAFFFFFFNYMVNLYMSHTIMRMNAKKAKLLLIPQRHIQEGDTEVKSSQCNSSEFGFFSTKNVLSRSNCSYSQSCFKSEQLFPMLTITEHKSSCRIYCSYETYIPPKSHPHLGPNFSILSLSGCHKLIAVTFEGNPRNSQPI